MKDRGDHSITWKELFRSLFQANLQLAFSKAALVLPTQPVQVTMRWQQAGLADKKNPRFLSAFAAAKEIYKDKNSLLPFFRGGGAGGVKEFIKNATYKGAFITGAPDLANQFLAPTLFNLTSPLQYHFIKSSFAGLFAGVGEAYLGGAFDAWATFLATSQGANASKSFWGEVSGEPTSFRKMKRVYRGGVASTVKNTVAFTTYFAANEPIKNSIMQMYDVKHASQLPWHGHLLSALLLGGTVATTSSPFDIIKTQKQMPNPPDISFFRALSSNYRTYGINGITAGLPLKFVMITLGWAMTNIATQQISSEHKETPNNSPKP